jgi:hypothetical protein
MNKFTPLSKTLRKLKDEDDLGIHCRFRNDTKCYKVKRATGIK